MFDRWTCNSCKYEDLESDEEPCNSCNVSKWETKEDNEDVWTVKF